MLLSLLDPTSPFADYYSRLYSLQLLSAVCAARPERLQECVLSAPLGVSRLVGVLDDGRDAVRNAGLLLLVDLTGGANEDLRKIVAFEDVFAKVFGLIKAEGGLAEAGIIAQDCLALLANLIKGSASNQTMFRESGCVTQLAQLLGEAFPPDMPEPPFVAQGREKAAWGLLQLLGLFLEAGEASTQQNQGAFFRAGTARVLVDLGFEAGLPIPVRAAALLATSKLIAHNPQIQETFAGLTVNLSPFDESRTKSASQSNGTHSGAASTRGSARPSVERPRTYIVEALLELALSKPQEDSQLRAAACSLIQAYLSEHALIRSHFLKRAIAGHAEHEAAANVLNSLLSPDSDANSAIFASWIVCDLIVDDLEAKAALTAVKEGDESEGEDVLTFVQAIGAQLSDALQTSDERLVAAYAGLLAVFLWEFADGVNTFLAEGSGLIQNLINVVSKPTDEPIIAGLAAVLLGAVYEFSTKDSPIPRRTLAPLLTQKLGRSKYHDALAQVRRDPIIRDFDLMPSGSDRLFSESFVDLLLIEYSRLRKAIDKDPGVEVLPPSASEAGVDRDILDELRQQAQTSKDAATTAQNELVEARQQHEQERMTTLREVQTVSAEVERLRKINQAMQQNHESEMESVTRKHEQSIQQLQAEHERALEISKQEGNRQVEMKLREHGATTAQKMQEYERRIAELGNNHRSEQGKHAETVRQLEALTMKHAELGTTANELRTRLSDLSQRHEKMSREHEQLKAQSAHSNAELERVRGELEKRQELVSRLSMQIKELRDELKGRDDELKTEREGFAELEKELETAKKQLLEAQNAARSAKEASTAGSGEVEQLRKQLKDVKEQGKAGSGEVDALRRQLKEAKESESSAREELESMLLVMGDIETKRDEYKAKIKELGGEITDDEDEDEEEDEEEEEEDEDKDVD